MRRTLPGLGALLSVLSFGPAVAQTMPPLNCTIRPSNVVEIAAPVPGVIREVHVKPGQEVKAGDLLAVFDDDLARAELAMAEARATSTSARDAAIARRDGLLRKLERLERARLQRAISEADLEQAQLELALAEGDIEAQEEALSLAAIDVERARLVLAKTRVVSPVSGVVGEDPIDPGESPTQQPIVTIYVVKPLRVEAYVPTALLPSFIERPNYAIIVNGKAAAPVPVTLDHVSQVADLSSDTQSVFFTFDAPGILPGYKCQMLP